jgi:predicted NACHT family NTPase
MDLIVWGVSAGFLFKPILEDLVKDATKDWAKDFLKDSLKHVIKWPNKEPLDIAVGKALTEFLRLVQQELEDAALTEEQIKQYIPLLKKFTSDKAVRALLGSAFKNKEILMRRGIAKSWQELNLQKLPDEFDWEKLAKRYIKKVEAIIRESEELREILDSENLGKIEKNTAALAGLPVDFDLQKYQETIREQYGNLKLDSLDTSGSAYNELKLWRMFVPQNVRECQEFLPQVYEMPKEYLRQLHERKQLDIALSAEEWASSRAQYLQQPVRPVLEVVDAKSLMLTSQGRTEEGQHIVILGDPGSGKSTLLQYLALKWTELPPSELPLHRIPLLIELRTYMRSQETQGCQSFLEFIHRGSGHICHLNQNELHKLLKDGDALVMFDGLDEVFDQAKREDIIADIHSFVTDYSKILVIVTSRVIGYKPQKLRDAKFHHFMLQDLDKVQIEDFIKRWHDLTFSSAEEGKKIDRRARLQRAINDSSGIRELAGNPLLLTMMAILNRSQELPKDRAELYSQASRLLLQQWDVERALTDLRIAPNTIDYKDKQAMLRQVAYHMQANEKGLAGNVIGESDLEDVLERYLKSIEVGQARSIARVIREQLRTRNFILCYLGAETYGFVHRTFLEYFCAAEFVDRFEKQRTLTDDQLTKDVFGKHWQDETWHEVLCLITGMVGEIVAGKIIDYLIDQRDTEYEFTNIFLAARCLSDVRNRSSIKPTAQRLLSWLKALSDEDSSFNAIIAIATIWRDDPSTLIWLKALMRSGENRNIQISDFQDLVMQIIAREWKDDPDTLPFLKTLIQSEKDSNIRSSAVRILARKWKDDPDTLPFLKTLIQSDEYSYVRYTAVGALAEGWKDDPDTLPFLKTLIQSEKDSNIRSAAVEALAREWKDDPDTLPLLKTLTSDEDSNVRFAAVEALAEGWKEDLNTLPFLKTLTSDEDSNVRFRLVNFLAEGWKDDPDTLPLLKTLIQSEEDSNVRSSAVMILAEGWKDDPDTVPFLKTLIQSEKDSYALFRAVRILARKWKDDPDTLPFLKTLIQSDEDSYVRYTAVGALAEGWKDDPGTLPLLKTLTSDEYSYVRYTAVGALAEGWKDDPDTLPFLKTLIQSEKDSNIRSAAIETLAEGWKDDPDTLSLLKTLTSDEDSYVRYTAVGALAEGWKDDSDVYILLCNRAKHDPFERKEVREKNPRLSALWAVARRYPHSSKDSSSPLFLLLNDRLENDPDEQVRKFASKKLQIWEGIK